jgi:hypothetical protein
MNLNSVYGFQIDHEADAETPCADPSLNGTIVVTSSYIETRFVSPRHEGHDVENDCDGNDGDLKKVKKNPL